MSTTAELTSAERETMLTVLSTMANRLEGVDEEADAYDALCQALGILGRPTCEHDPDDDCNALHWAEDTYGNEYRVDCGCPCQECREY